MVKRQSSLALLIKNIHSSEDLGAKNEDLAEDFNTTREKVIKLNC